MKAGAWIWAAGGILSLLAATRAPAALGPVYGGSVRLELSSLPDTVDPAHRTSTPSRWPLALVQETLLQADERGRPRPRLAAVVSTSAESREWALQLVDGLIFHDGRAVTASDAARSLRRFLRSASPAAASLASSLDGGGEYRDGRSEMLPGIAVTDERHLVLRTVTADERVLLPLTAVAAAPTSPGGAGAGPFVPSLWTTKRAVLTAFPGHVLGRPLLDEVQITLSGTGGADLRPTPTSDFRVMSSASATLLLVLDTSRPPFDKQTARAAVSAAIDRRQLVQHFLRRGQPARSLLPAALGLPSATAPAASAAAPGRLSGSTVLAVATDVLPAASQRVVAHLEALGLAVNVRPVSPDAIAGSPAAARLLLWSPEIATPGLALAELQALGGHVAPEARRLLAEARASDVSVRDARLSQAEAALLLSQALLPLAAVPVEVHVRPGIHGVGIDAAGILQLADAWREP
jgi:MarR-like DNA-binding transcriptional regulator SgrR of sgrS sRNA